MCFPIAVINWYLKREIIVNNFNDVAYLLCLRAPKTSTNILRKHLYVQILCAFIFYVTYTVRYDLSLTFIIFETVDKLLKGKPNTAHCLRFPGDWYDH